MEQLPNDLIVELLQWKEFLYGKASFSQIWNLLQLEQQVQQPNGHHAAGYSSFRLYVPFQFILEHSTLWKKCSEEMNSSMHCLYLLTNQDEELHHPLAQQHSTFIRFLDEECFESVSHSHSTQ